MEDFMGSLSIWHWLIVGAVLLLVFGGRGKISDMMGDVAKGIKAFKKGMTEEEASARSPTHRSSPSTIRRPPKPKGAPRLKARSGARCPKRPGGWS
jgi:sec-independent protein translocase protein TatA